MTDRTSIPEGPAFTAAWRALDRDARRRIRRAVNRAQAAEDPREAALAVTVARGQQRFWRYGWLLGPVFAGVLLIREPLATVIANAVFAVVVFGVLAWFFTRRARQAEQRNLEAAGRRRKPRPAATPPPDRPAGNPRSGRRQRRRKKRKKRRR